jgi:hypothetical protein
MRLPEFTAEASLGKISEHYVLTSGYTAGASTRSLQPQFHAVELNPPGGSWWCAFAAIGCIYNDYNCASFFKNCVPPLVETPG